MKTVHFYLMLSTIVALSLVTEAWSLDVKIATTKAHLSNGSAIQTNFRTELVNTVGIDPTQIEIAVDWQRFGGIVPCVKLVMPVGCFVGSEGFYVSDSEDCGARLTFDPDGQGPIDLTLIHFAARFGPSRRDDTVSSLTVEMTFGDEDELPAILSLLGGPQVIIDIDRETATAFPISVKSVAVSADPI